MRYFRLCLTLCAAGAALAAGDRANGNGDGANDAARMTNAASHRPLPPVLREPEPSDSVLVRLPGPPAPKTAQPSVDSTQMVAKAVEPAVKLEPPPPGTLEDPGRPVLRRAPKPMYPPGFEKDSAMYIQKLIGQWTAEDANMLLGDAHGTRPAFDDKQKENGTIYAFADPTGRYRQIELDFDGDTGTLRTVFGYPWNLSWEECRRVWGANVSAAEANKGRKFYSYLNRRLDVLVDRGGKVISLGLY